MQQSKRSMIISGVSVLLTGLLLSGMAAAASNIPEGMVLIPAGEFAMGDHHDLGGAEHGNDEIPIHAIYVDAFYIGKTEVTNQQYAAYLDAAFAQRLIEVRDGLVFGVSDHKVYCETRSAVPYSRIGWDGRQFTVLDQKEAHPVIGVRWEGAAAYTNWLSVQNGYAGCYNLAAGTCDFSQKGFRLPTEAEWEYAGRGGQYKPYALFPWGDAPDITRANWPNSGDPYETGPQPWTTPAGFYNGQFRQKADFGWPGQQTSYQTANGANGYGLYDMAGNAWEWCHDWYGRDYYAESSSTNPQGPTQGSPMPDGLPYHVLRGGSWYNGEWGHARVSNRNPSYFRGPDDPNHAWYHIGLRVVLDLNGTARRTGGAPQPQTGSSPDKSAAKRPPKADEQRPRPPRPDGNRAAVDAAVYAACLNRTADNAACKDCCDCLDADPGVRKVCRDACPAHDFSQNKETNTVAVPSILGREGDYSACTAASSEQACKQCCESSTAYVCGDRQFCRTACAQLSSSGERPSKEGAEQPRQPK